MITAKQYARNKKRYYRKYNRNLQGKKTKGVNKYNRHQK
jgi:hypothetical protein